MGHERVQLPPRPDNGQPHVCLDTHVVMDHAVVALAERRFIERLDTGAQCHLLASLIAQGEQCVVEGVGLARDDQASLASLGRLLGVTATVRLE